MYHFLEKSNVTHDYIAGATKDDDESAFEDQDGDQKLVTRHSFVLAEGTVSEMYIRPLSYFEVLSVYLKANLGMGVFAMGYGFKSSGTVVGSVLFVAMFLLTLKSVHDLCKLAQKVADFEEKAVRPNLGETVTYTLERGPRLIAKYSTAIGTFTKVILVVTQMGVCCSYYVFIADHMGMTAMSTIQWKWPLWPFYAMVSVPLCALAWIKSFKTLYPMTVVGNLLMFIGIVLMLLKIGDPDDAVSSDEAMFRDFKNIPVFFGCFAFAVDGSSYMLCIKNSMADPKTFTKWWGACNVGLCISGSITFTVGFLSYWTYGSKVESSVFKNLDQNDQLVQCLNVLASMTMLCTYYIHQMVIYDTTFKPFLNKFGPFKHPTVMLLVFRIAQIAIVFAVAATIPLIDLFISLNGALIGGLLLVIPNMLHLALLNEQPGCWSLVKNGFFFLFGMILMISGLGTFALQVYDLIKGRQLQMGW